MRTDTINQRHWGTGSRRFYLLVLAIIVLFVVSCANEQELADWKPYTDVAGGYTLALPPSWTVENLDGGMIAFKYREGGAVIGGVNILGRYPQANKDSEYRDALPNQSKELHHLDVTTAVGVGRIYTIERSTDGQITREQHAVIPVNDRFYDIWLKVEPQAGYSPVPLLRKMLTAFRLTSADG